jgi:hypothetical protein
VGSLVVYGPDGWRVQVKIACCDRAAAGRNSPIRNNRDIFDSDATGSITRISVYGEFQWMRDTLSQVFSL